MVCLPVLPVEERCMMKAKRFLGPTAVLGSCFFNVLQNHMHPESAVGALEFRLGRARTPLPDAASFASGTCTCTRVASTRASTCRLYAHELAPKPTPKLQALVLAHAHPCPPPLCVTHRAPLSDVQSELARHLVRGCCASPREAGDVSRGLVPVGMLDSAS